MEKNTQNTYEDIMTLKRPKSVKHPPMAKLARAAQFAPFAALTGHREAMEAVQEKNKEG